MSKYSCHQPLFSTQALGRQDATPAELRGSYPGLSSRVPRLRALKITWDLSTAQSDSQLTAELERLLVMGADMNDDVEEALFPPLLQRLSFARDFKRAVERLSEKHHHPPLALERPSKRGGEGGCRSPGSLRPAPSTLPLVKELVFGSYFNEELDETFELPSSLTRLNMGSWFNRPIDRVKWPRGMRHLSLGWRFNFPVAEVVWPPSLQTLEFGYAFNQPIVSVAWPASLKEIHFSGMFSEAIDGVRRWPPVLELLSFGDGFNKPVVGVTWPASLRQLTFGWGFNQPIAGVDWPASLQQLSFGWKFNQPVAGVAWPDSLEQLEFGRDFNQPISGVAWPVSLQRLEFGGRFSQPFDDVVLPSSLLLLVFGYRVDLDNIVLPAGATVVRYT